MKKVIVLAAAALLFATPALAVIANTAHDLSLVNGGTSTETCVYCHTPHSADTTVTLAPLWNRSTALATGSVYAGVDLETSTTNQMTITAINQTDAPLCLSCHDGSVSETLVNEPNNGNTDLTGYTFGSAAANLGTDMSNDHPIGFSYSDAAGTDTELVAFATVDATLSSPFFGAANDMWCSSCHDVHDDTNSPFLRISNDSSNLCLACHIK